MLEILDSIPSFVWPLFAILLIGGLKARKTSFVPIKALVLFPAAFFGWSLLSFFGSYTHNILAIILWLLCLMGGIFVGYSHLQRLKLRFDTQKQMVEMPGSYIPLVLSMSLFFAKFSIGVIRSTVPESEGSILVLELFSSLILGVLAGRAISCLLQYKKSVVEPQNS